jgi:non-specific serine/threonine protein kinase
VRFVSKDTVEEKIIRLQKAKTDLADDIIGEQNFIKEVISNMNTLLE